MNKYHFKLLLTGDGAVGKTSLILKYVENRFKHKYKPTLGVDLFIKQIRLGDCETKLTIWDIAGQERFKIIRRRFYEGASGVLLVYDVTRSETLESVPEWMQELYEYVGKVPVITIGNKVDLTNKRDVSARKAKEHTKSIGNEHMETSAKTGKNVNQSFTRIAKEMLQYRKKT
ncbi:MAG: Rab family GTPase [Candidatus Hodarchaeota archaeon]